MFKSDSTWDCCCARVPAVNESGVPVLAGAVIFPAPDSPVADVRSETILSILWSSLAAGLVVPSAQLFVAGVVTLPAPRCPVVEVRAPTMLSISLCTVPDGFGVPSAQFGPAE